jgi:glycosyltransferase involved in cell wall biosynthesis
MTLTVTLPFYNERDFLPETLRSLLAQESLPDFFLLIDNGSTDGSADIARQILNESKIPFEILQEARPGKAQALETACKWLTEHPEQQGDLLMCPDADTWYPPHYLARARTVFTERPNISCLLAWPHKPTLWNRLCACLLPRRGHTGGYGHIYRTQALLEAGGYSPKIWPFALMDHEILLRLLPFGALGYDTQMWCRPSERRGDRKRVRWTAWERFLYHACPTSKLRWFFYTYLWKRFEARKISGLNLREQPWQKRS